VRFEGDDYKKGRQLFWRKKCTHRQNLGYAYVKGLVFRCKGTKGHTEKGLDK